MYFYMPPDLKISLQFELMYAATISNVVPISNIDPIWFGKVALPRGLDECGSPFVYLADWKKNLSILDFIFLAAASFIKNIFVGPI